MSERLHSIIVEDRKKMSLSGVSDAESFDENTVIIYTSSGNMTVKGKNLKVETLSTETGDMSLTGEINSIIYGDRDRNKRTGFFGKLMR